MRLLQRLFVFTFSLLLINAIAQKPVPELWGLHVHDEAHVLKQATVDELEKQLIQFEDSTSNQVAVLLVASLDGEAIEDYSLRVAEKWKLGQKEKSNGVLLLIATDDHKMRIEVGQGLEGVLTDVQSNRIIRNEMAPEFRRDDYDAGVAAGVNGIIKSIGGEYDANDVDGDFDLVTKIVVGLALLVVLGISTTVSLLLLEGKAVWWAYLVHMPFYIAFPWISIGVIGGVILFIVYLIGYPLLSKVIAINNRKSSSASSSRRSSKEDNDSSSSSGSGSSIWSSSSSSSGGSSFSGGGGSFGGGGSSGSW